MPLPLSALPLAAPPGNVMDCAPGTRPMPSHSTKVTSGEGFVIWKRTPGTSFSAMWMAVCACNDNSLPARIKEVPLAKDAGKISWSTRWSSSAAPEANCFFKGTSAWSAAAPHTSYNDPRPRPLGPSCGPTDAWKRPPFDVCTTISHAALFVLASGGATASQRTNTLGGFAPLSASSSRNQGSKSSSVLWTSSSSSQPPAGEA
mmetsp:Transcript_10019/g.26606  ORF Transcript_10019/g.26606 Transcript_10019/m.26606 type:complete len:203 (-) Transcript_10019:1302-1910(-)